MLKILKRLRRWRNSSGFTLIEVIVAGALLGVLILGVLGFVQPVLKSVATKEQNARAVMLAESIYSYVTSSLKYAVYVQTISGVVESDTVGTTPPIRNAKFTNTDLSATYLTAHNGEGLEDLMVFYSGLDASKYEVRAIGFRWVEDGKTGEKKIVLTNEYVDTTTLALDSSKAKLVFDTCFYDDLYPIIKVENYDNQWIVVDASGTEIPQVDPADVDIAAGLKIVADVYIEPDCYNTVQAVRDVAMLNYEGTGYVDFPNIKNNLLNPTGSRKVQPTIEFHNYDTALGSSTSAVYSDGTDSYYYPNTFIYYVTRKPAA